jgi:hypothetical protein
MTGSVTSSRQFAQGHTRIVCRVDPRSMVPGGRRGELARTIWGDRAKTHQKRCSRAVGKVGSMACSGSGGWRRVRCDRLRWPYSDTYGRPSTMFLTPKAVPCSAGVFHRHGPILGLHATANGFVFRSMVEVASIVYVLDAGLAANSTIAATAVCAVGPEARAGSVWFRKPRVVDVVCDDPGHREPGSCGRGPCLNLRRQPVTWNETCPVTDLLAPPLV